MAHQQQTIAATAAFQKVAKDASDRLTAIAYIQTQQTRFSSLLADIAKVVPKGVSISSITLTGDASKPVRLAISGSSYDSILAFREAVVSSPRIAAADLENIAQASSGYTASVVIAFKPGQAK